MGYDYSSEFVVFVFVFVFGFCRPERAVSREPDAERHNNEPRSMTSATLK